MSTEVLFTEKQRFTQWWVWLISFIPLLLSSFGLIYQLVTGNPFGNNPADNREYLFIIGSSLLVPLLITCISLRTKVLADGIVYRFSPFHLKNRFIPFSDIQKCNVREYSPLKEYGGWGIRYGLSGKCYNISGNKGLQLYLKNGRKLMIGTRRAAELEKVIEKAFVINRP